MGPDTIPKRVWHKYTAPGVTECYDEYEYKCDSDKEGYVEYIRSDIVAKLEEELEGFRKVRQVLEDFESGCA